MQRSYRTLSEFCSTRVYQQQYPDFLGLILASSGSRSSMNPLVGNPQYVLTATTPGGHRVTYP
jgi:hypothetical protein